MYVHVCWHVSSVFLCVLTCVGTCRFLHACMHACACTCLHVAGGLCVEVFMFYA